MTPTLKPRSRTVLRGLKAALRALQEVAATAPERKAALLRVSAAHLSDELKTVARTLGEGE